MATLTTKYSIGDVVWFDEPTLVKRKFPCPDCLDTKVWKAVSPVGTEYEFNCPRCSGIYKSDARLNLEYPEYTACTRQLTIGSVRVDTQDTNNPVSYMCVETGVDSGSVYNEDRLHPTKEEAERVSTILATFRNTNPKDFVLPLYNERLELCDYQLKQVTALPKPKRKRK